ncbi:Zinc finger protein zat11 [Thalictrum thalictroides]|uniref:Zinc finger protein zat11 n=1 Tax=Thalictrum thalictroides TaxID=46969 RepID=A0A7J6VDY3_THATH|nr:Zinc finger protein zat11 [Thalictrum thalictroides]
MIMKRNRESTETHLKTMAADCLMLFSHQGEIDSLSQSTNRSYVCKTCNREFSSFQALGGHRASHKKPRLMGGDQIQVLSSLQAKSKTHECSICGLEFAIGQALGGHMRRHRAMMMSSSSKSFITNTAPSKLTTVPVFRRSNSKRIVSLDLNLAPFENGLEFRPIEVGFLANIKSPVIHSFI